MHSRLQCLVDSGVKQGRRTQRGALKGVARCPPGRGHLPSILDLAPLVGLVGGVKGPGVTQGLLAVVPAHGHQVSVGHKRQDVCIPGAWPWPLHHHPAQAAASLQQEVQGAGGSEDACWCRALNQGLWKACSASVVKLGIAGDLARIRALDMEKMDICPEEQLMAHLCLKT